MRSLGRFVDYFLFTAMAIVLIIKLLSFFVGWFNPWMSTINLLMILLVGLYGILNGLRLWPNLWGILSLIAGLLIILEHFTSLISAREIVVVVCIIAILVVAFVGPRARKSRRR